jgi:ribosome-binding protein aMBF1 (putative translation factor)
MNTKLATLRKCGNAATLHTTDVQYAAERAVTDARVSCGLSRSGLARRLGVVVDTIRRYETGRTAVNTLVIERDPEFAAVFRAAFEVRKAEIRRAA